jgi:hypothetical protein
VDFAFKIAPLYPGDYGGDHQQEVASEVAPNRIISKKMMKVTTQFRVKYQCMPRFAV